MKWPLLQLKHVARFGYGEALPTDEVQSGLFSVFGSNGPYGTLGRANTLGPVIVIGRKGSYGKVNWSDEPCFASDTTFYVDASTTRHDLRWLYWLLQTLRLDEGSDEAAVPGLNREEAYARRVPLPSPTAQTTIARFLDFETHKLDSLLAAKQRVLDLLAEKRKAIISTAVTRGLDPQVELRDSGVPWLGEIPAHWEVVPFRWFFRVGSGDFIATDEVAAEPDAARATPVIGGNGVAGFTAAANTSDAASIVVGRVGAQCGNVHVVTGLAWVTDNALLLRDIREYKVEYLAHVLRHRDLNSIANKTAQPLITGSMVTELRGPLPPLDEQQVIVEHIARETAKLDAVRAATERTIALLKERRTALIAAAVTGQLDVGAAA